MEPSCRPCPGPPLRLPHADPHARLHADRRRGARARDRRQRDGLQPRERVLPAAAAGLRPGHGRPRVLQSLLEHGAALVSRVRDRNSTLAGLAAFQLRSFGLRIDAETEHSVRRDRQRRLFLGPRRVDAARGRLLVAVRRSRRAPPAVVLSHAFWTRRFGGSPDVIGRTIALNDQPFTIVGVAAEGFTGVLAPLVGDLWVPLAADALLRPGARSGRAARHGQPAPGRPAQARRRSGARAGGSRRDRPAAAPGRGAARPRTGGHGLRQARCCIRRSRRPLTAFTAVLMVVVALVLLIVCVNVANLVLARAAGPGRRAGRPAVARRRARTAGSSAADGEPAAVAGRRRRRAGDRVLGHAAADGGCRCRRPCRSRWISRSTCGCSPSRRFVAVAATLAFGLMPALSASRVDLMRAAQEARPPMRRATAGCARRFWSRRSRCRCCCWSTAGLFIRSFRHAQSIDTGFDAGHVLTASIDLETRGYSEARGREFIRVARRASRSGARRRRPRTCVDIIPLTLSNRTDLHAARRRCRTRRAISEPPTPQIYMQRGRPGAFQDAADRDARRAATSRLGTTRRAPAVAIVNETLARRFWPGTDAVGQRLRPLGAGATLATRRGRSASCATAST